MKNDIEILDAERQAITYGEMLKMAQWSWGDEGGKLATLWQSLNQKHFRGELQPLPLWQCRTFPYGRAIGLFSANLQGQSLSIQLKHSMGFQEKADTLLHEMVHQILSEQSRPTGHNTSDWCEEIVRLSAEIWGAKIWASPDLPRKEKQDGKWHSTRKQALGPQGETSISRVAIAGWPDSIGLHLPVGDYL